MPALSPWDYRMTCESACSNRKEASVLTGTCYQCRSDYTLSKDNSVLIYYTKQPWVSHVVMTCQKDAFESLVFLRDNLKEWIGVLLDTGVRVIGEHFPEADIINRFSQVYEVRELAEVDITPRMKLEIQAHADFLDHTPDEWIHELFSHPAPNLTLPLTWNDQ
jgi:hypothetical protein